MAKEEYLIKLAGLDQEVTRLEQQMQLLEQQVLELQNIKTSLEELEKSKGKEIMANLGKNVFIKAEIKDKKLLVDVGNRTFIKKSITETLDVIEDQVNKISEAKGSVLNRIQEIQQEMENILVEAEKEKVRCSEIGRNMTRENVSLC